MYSVVRLVNNTDLTTRDALRRIISEAKRAWIIAACITADGWQPIEAALKEAALSPQHVWVITNIANGTTDPSVLAQCLERGYWTYVYNGETPPFNANVYIGEATNGWADVLITSSQLTASGVEGGLEIGLWLTLPPGHPLVSKLMETLRVWLTRREMHVLSRELLAAYHTRFAPVGARDSA